MFQVVQVLDIRLVDEDLVVDVGEEDRLVYVGLLVERIVPVCRLDEGVLHPAVSSVGLVFCKYKLRAVARGASWGNATLKYLISMPYPIMIDIIYAKCL